MSDIGNPFGIKQPNWTYATLLGELSLFPIASHLNTFLRHGENIGHVRDLNKKKMFKHNKKLKTANNSMYSSKIKLVFITTSQVKFLAKINRRWTYFFKQILLILKNVVKYNSG